MEDLGADAFTSTERNQNKGTGNTNPRKSLSQQPAVQLSQVGAAWLLSRFEDACTRHGTIPNAKLKDLDWPAIDAL